MTILAPPCSQKPDTGGHEIYNFGRGLPSLHNCAISFSSTCAEVEKIFENWSNFFSLGPTPRAPRVQET